MLSFFQCYFIASLYIIYTVCSEVDRFLMGMVKTYALNQFKLSRQKQVFDNQMLKTFKNLSKFASLLVLNF